MRVLFLGGLRDEEAPPVRGVPGEGVLISVGESMLSSSELLVGVVKSMAVRLV